MRPFIILLVIFLTATSTFAQNDPPEITNLVVQFDENTRIVTINYDLFDAESDLMEVRLLASNNDGKSYLIDTGNATGDVGVSISSGNGKSINWDASGLLVGIGEYRVKLVADDLLEIDIQEIVDQVDSNKVRSNLEFIEGIRHRIVNPAHLESIKDSIEQRFILANLDTYREDFLFGNYTGQNIIGRLEGMLHADSTYIIDGHFDTVQESPGADDNGSAVAGMLEVLRVLAPYRFNKTLRFIGFDLEEEGLKGSIAFANNGIPEEETIKGVFNMEMIGYYTEEPNTQTFPPGFEILYPDVQAELAADEFRGNFITNIGDENSVPLQTAYNNAAAEYVPGLKVISLVAPENWSIITPDFGRSDHAPFWISGRPALFLTDGANFRNPNYHSPNDTLGTLNFTFMTNVVKAVVGTVAEEAGIIHSTSSTANFSVTTSIHNALNCEWRMSPVPANENVLLNFERCAVENLKVQVVDVLGKLLLEEEVQPAISTTTTLNLTALDSGVYFLRLTDGKRSLSRKLLVE